MLVCAQAHAILNAHDIAARETAGVFDSFCMLQDNASSVLIFSKYYAKNIRQHISLSVHCLTIATLARLVRS